MVIYNKENDTTFKYISLFLSVDEAKYLRDSINSLLEEPLEQGNHVHVNNKTFTKEILVAVYPSDRNLKGFFDKDSVRLIEEDK